MNDRFFLLPEERQNIILNAGYKIFSEHPYKKAPVASIAEEAGISKSLLFHYFKNKKELYFYLWRHSSKLTGDKLKECRTYETSDLFDMFRRSLKGKCDLMRVYPHIASFSMKAYFEQDPEVKALIQSDFDDAYKTSLSSFIARVDISVLRDDIDIQMFYKEMLWAVSGYMQMVCAHGTPDPDEIEHTLFELLDFWKHVYCKK